MPMLKACFAMTLATLLLVASPALAETLTNDSIVQLARVGLGANAVVAKIRASDTDFDVSTRALVALKRQDVPDDVIAAMVASAAGGGAPGSPIDQRDSADPAAPHAAGVYLLQSEPAPRMQQLDPTLADDVKASSALGWILTYGLVPLKVTTVLDNPTARFKADTRRPNFYFYFNQPGSGLYRNGLGTMRLDGPAPSPGEFTLLHFQTVGGVRQALTQQLGFGRDQTGGVGDVRVPFSYAEVAPGVFEVTPNADLDPGEYAFMVTPADGDDDAQARFFDFSTAH
jgi:hypothetical protein